MERRVMGQTGMEVSALGFGGAEIGFRRVEPETVSRLLNSALDAGLNVIDTAECYANSEELIGRAVGHRRNDYYLFTKCGHSAGFDLEDWDIRLLERSIDRSLQRLRTDRLDLIQLHTCSEELLRRGEVIEVLQHARQAGKARFIGYSGDGQAARYAVECGAFDTLQTSLNIADQESIALTIPRARERGMGVIIKRPIANVAWMTGEKEDAYGHVYWQRLNRLAYDFLRGEPGSVVEIALRFTLSVPGVSTAIVGTARPGRWQENAERLKAGPLPAEMFDAIRRRWQEVAEADWVGQA